MLEIVLDIQDAVDTVIEDSELRGFARLATFNVFSSRRSQRPTERPALSHPKKFSHEEICAILPQQPPFLFLDEAVIDGKEITATYLVRGDEFLLKGHFKNDPVFPGLDHF